VSKANTASLDRAYRQAGNAVTFWGGGATVSESRSRSGRHSVDTEEEETSHAWHSQQSHLYHWPNSMRDVFRSSVASLTNGRSLPLIASRYQEGGCSHPHAGSGRIREANTAGQRLCSWCER